MKRSKGAMAEKQTYFLLRERKSTLLTEFFAGVSTYLSLAYIFVVNPAILGNAHMDPSMVLFATAVASGLTTLAMGMWARLPFAVAPGLEMNGFFAFYVVGRLGLSWQDALGTVFWSGVLYLILAALPVRQKIVDSIPAGLKISIGASVGVFVATIGLKLAGIVSFKDGLPNLWTWHFSTLITNEARVLYVGFFISLVLGLRRFRFPGGMFVAIVISTVVCKGLGIGQPVHAHLNSAIWTEIGQVHILSVLHNRHFLPVALTFLIINFLGDIGKFIGLTASAKTILEDGKVPRMEAALYTDSSGTVLGSILGTSNLITYVESAVGIAAGGRTGITAIVCGLLMLTGLVFTPIIGFVPVEATAGILVYVGYLLLPTRQFREDRKMFGTVDLIIATAMGLISFFLFDLNMAMVLGFAGYTLYELYTRKKANSWLTITTLALAGAVILQHFWGTR
jgi:AGZA family xanthine/uracil permease-like MFS transporter